jgi:IS30 family transposase
MKYRTRRYFTESDKVLMWDRAHRAKTCKLAQNRALAFIVAEKLQLEWSPRQIAGTITRASKKTRSMLFITIFPL